jgi:nucleoside-diphosphate-sugar epimerase
MSADTQIRLYRILHTGPSLIDAEKKKKLATMSGVGRRILLTGGNGFIGSHILDQLLDAGFHVRAVVRSQAKAESLQRDHPKAGPKLETAVVQDITVPGAFDSVLQAQQPPLDTVIHTASPFLYSVANDARDFLDPAIKGTTELLKSVKKTAPGVKRVIITSSFAAIGGFGQVDDAGKTYTSADWNPVTWEDALATKEMNFAYRASKKFAEKAGEFET